MTGAIINHLGNMRTWHIKMISAISGIRPLALDDYFI